MPAALIGLVMQMLAKNADDRPASARAVVEAIQAVEKSLNDPKRGLERRHRIRYGRGRHRNTVGTAKSTAVTPADAPPWPGALRRLWPRFAAAILLAALGAYWFGPAVVRYATDKGELVIEIDDPEVEVIINEQKGVTIHDKPHEGAAFVLKPGRHDLTAGDYEIQGDGSRRRRTPLHEGFLHQTRRRHVRQGDV